MKPKKPTPHGTPNGYMNYGCRCPRCRAAQAAYQRAKMSVPCAGGCGASVYGRFRPGSMCRACRAAVRTKPLVHGTESGYAKGCKCYSCRRAAADVRAANRHANIERERARDREYKRRKRMAAA